MQPSEIDALPYFEYEYTIEMYQEILEERNKEEKKQQENVPNADKYMSQANSYQKNATKFAKSPFLPKYNMPKFSMPRI